jgi:hypothetical protein
MSLSFIKYSRLPSNWSRLSRLWIIWGLLLENLLMHPSQKKNICETAFLKRKGHKMINLRETAF